MSQQRGQQSNNVYSVNEKSKLLNYMASGSYSVLLLSASTLTSWWKYLFLIFQKVIVCLFCDLLTIQKNHFFPPLISSFLIAFSCYLKMSGADDSWKSNHLEKESEIEICCQKCIYNFATKKVIIMSTKKYLRRSEFEQTLVRA